MTKHELPLPTCISGKCGWCGSKYIKPHMDDLVWCVSCGRYSKDGSANIPMLREPLGWLIAGAVLLVLGTILWFSIFGG